jgi:hypothetical protein
MKCRIEYGDLSECGMELRQDLYPFQVCRVVQRSQWDQSPDGLDYPFAYEGRLVELGTPMYDTMSNGIQFIYVREYFSLFEHRKEQSECMMMVGDLTVVALGLYAIVDSAVPLFLADTFYEY